MTQLSIKQLDAATGGAYSYDRYTRGGWRAAMAYLRKAHMLTDRQIIIFMLSKHTRWAGDMDDVRDYGRKNSTTIKDYIARYPKCLNDAKDPDWDGPYVDAALELAQ